MRPRLELQLPLLVSLLASVIGTGVCAEAAGPPRTAGVTQADRPLVIAHRGASGYRPEHTMGAYRLAVRQGADYIEPDLVTTKDRVLVALHDNNLSATTDVATRPEFDDRQATKTIGDHEVTDWFVEDFTLAELRTLRVVERLPDIRPANTSWDHTFRVPTFEEVLALVHRVNARRQRDIGVAPELKRPAYFRQLGLPLEELAAAALRHHGLAGRNAPVLVQSYEPRSLRRLNARTNVPLAQLVGKGTTYEVAAGGALTWRQLTRPASLRRLSRYVDWLAPEKSLVLAPRPTRLVRRAHGAGLRVATFTVRAENHFLPPTYRRGTAPSQRGAVGLEVRALLDAGVDAVFADHPDRAVAARDRWHQRR